MSKREEPPREDELPALAEDVVYEHRMFRFAGGRLIRNPLPTGAIRNALVEVLWLHQRNLTEFLANDNPTRDDVAAVHYAPDWTPDDGGDDLAWLVDRLPVAHKRLAHLTAYRQRTPKADDASLIPEAMTRMAGVWSAFIEALPSDRRDWFTR